MARLGGNWNSLGWVTHFNNTNKYLLNSCVCFIRSLQGGKYYYLKVNTVINNAIEIFLIYVEVHKVMWRGQLFLLECFVWILDVRRNIKEMQ